MNITRMVAGLVALVLGPAVLAAAEPPSLHIPRLELSPSLAAFVSGEPPAGPARVSTFVQREPRDGRPSAVDTTAYLWYDQAQLYVVFVCRDTTDGIRARVTKREGASDDDRVSVHLDTFHDRRRAYVFSSNPLGVQADRITTEGQDDDDSFDTVWRSDAALTPFGYVVKMSIPFRSLRFSAAAVQTWGVALSRQVPRLSEDAYWPEVSRRVQGVVPQFAVATGLQDVSPGANVQLIPYGAFTGSQDGAGASLSQVERLGLDAKVGLGSAFVLDAAVNPDFSEVESDDPQVTLNERFEVLFPEKRPFFVENAGYFATPVPLFFSRRLRDPRSGVRLTGKSGGWVTAGLVMQDRATPDFDAATAAAGSVRREFGQGAHLGALATIRRGAAVSNKALSLDGRLTLGDTWAVAGQVMRTAGSDAAGPGTSGLGLFAELTHDSRHLDMSTRYTDLAHGFDAALGFLQRVDMRQLEHTTKYRFRPKHGWLARYGPTLDAFAVWDRQRALTDWRMRPRFELEFVGQTSLLVDHARSMEVLGGLRFDKHRTTAEFETARSRWWTLAASYEQGTDVNRRPPRGQAPFLVDRQSSEVVVALRPGRHLEFSETYLRTRLQQPGGTPAGAHPVLDNHIARTKVLWHLTRELSLRTIVDYERVVPNPLFSSVRARQPFGVDVLGTYQVNPGTAVFVGYVDRYEPDVFRDPFPLLPVATSVGRQAFVKVSWLFRY